MVMKLEASWYAQLQEELQKPYINDLKKFLNEEKEKGYQIFPPEEKVFSAFSKTPFSQVKVVIVGQDPYHGTGQAHGLSFSVAKGVPIPPSLRNIYLELREDIKMPIPQHGFLERWAEQGVLLLNATLTVRSGEPKSHYGKGWERFTDAVIAKLALREDPLVFILWGRSAQEKFDQIEKIKKGEHLILRSAHPSPFSATKFLGCRHFSKANDFLLQHGKKPIIWNLD